MNHKIDFHTAIHAAHRPEVYSKETRQKIFAWAQRRAENERLSSSERKAAREIAQKLWDTAGVPWQGD